jgi:large subunit ribosomal protein L5
MEAGTVEQTSQAAPPPRLRDKYEQEILPELTRRFGYSTPMEAPRLLKITLNMGLGTEKQDKRSFEAAQNQLATIAGQYPNVRRARMWEFLDRLTSIAVPRIRDFRGLNPRSFDGRGNYSMGVKEQLIFPEIDYDSIDVVRGLDVTITTSAKTDLEAFELLLALGMPFAQEGRPGQEEREARKAEEEEEQRKEEARQKAEVEQEALEQLKEENPEAYAQPETEAEGGEAAEGGDDEAAEGGSEEKSDG